MMKISIILPTYNGAKYLNQLLESLRGQSRKADEVLFIDDCSTDNTVNLINSGIEENGSNDWKVHLNAVNFGVWRNFKEGWRYASGDLILFCDQDDIWHKDKIGIFEEAFSKEPEMDVLACDKEDFSGEFPYEDKASLSYDSHKLKKGAMYRNSFFTFGCTGCCIGVRKSFLDKIYDYWESDDLAYDSYIRIMGLVKKSYYFYHEKLVFMRLHDNNTTKRGTDSHNYEFQKYDAESNCNLMDAASRFAEDIRESGMSGITKRAADWASLRKRFYDNGKLLDGIRLFSFLDCYPRYKAYYEDLRYVFFGK